MAVALLVASPWLVPIQPAQAETDTAAVGACFVELTVNGNYTAVPPTGVTTLNVTGGGLCVVNGDPDVALTISGTLQPAAGVPTWTCLGGVAEGQLTFSIGHSKFLSNVAARVVFTVAGGAAAMVVADDTVSPAFTGAGAYVRDAASLASCPGTAGPMSFCGAFSFASGTAGPPVRS